MAQEDMVNERALQNHEVTTHAAAMPEAKARGAIGIFEKKYGAEVLPCRRTRQLHAQRGARLDVSMARRRRQKITSLGMATTARSAARTVTLLLAAGGIGFAVWRAQRIAPGPPALVPPTNALATPVPKRKARYGIMGPDSKADPHMSRAAALAEYEEVVGDAAPAQTSAPETNAADADVSDRPNYRYLPGSKSGFSGLGVRDASDLRARPSAGARERAGSREAKP